MASEALVIVRGGGDLGTGVAVRLWRAGLRVAVLETSAPVAVRRTVALSEAVYEGTWQVEDVTGVRLTLQELASWNWRNELIPVVVDGDGAACGLLSPSAVVDAIMAKRNMGTSLALAPCVVGLGPGFRAGEDVTAVIETNRGPDLGRVLWVGSAAADTGMPAPVHGHTAERLLRAPSSGRVEVVRGIGAIVETGDVVARVDGTPVRVAFPSLLRGMVRPGIEVERGMKIGDIDPRRDPRLCQQISDKALAVAGGVVEAVLACQSGRRP